MITQASGLASLVFTIIFTGFARAEECGQKELMRCATPLQVLTGTPELSFAVNKEELDKNCQDLFAGLLCITRYTRRCMSRPDRMHFMRMSDGINNVLKDLCREGAYQEEFLRHAPCMKTVKKEYETCTKTYEITLTTIGQQKGIQSNYSTVDTDMRHQEQLRTVCCSFQEFMECSEQTVRRTCGDEAATYTGAFLRRMASNIIKSYCEEYRGEQCGLPNSHQRQSISSLWLIMFLTLTCLLASVFREV